MQHLENLINILDKIDAKKITESEADKWFSADLTEAITLFSNHDRALVECVRLGDTGTDNNYVTCTIIKIHEVEEGIYDFAEIDRCENTKEIAFYKVDTERQYKDFLIAFIEDSKFVERP